MSEFSRRKFLGGTAATVLSGAVGSGSSAAQGTRAFASVVEQVRSASGSRQNIICFMPDELRADVLGCYGNAIAKTPNYDKLAAEGVLFEDCHVSFPICGPSRCAFLTGWPTSIHGHRSQSYFLRPDEPNLFRYLRQAGYDVFWAGKNDVLAQGSFADSVTEWQIGETGEFAGSAEDRASVHGGDSEGSKPPGPLTFMRDEAPPDRHTGKDYLNVMAGIRVLERKQTDRPFFLFLALTSPHPPYNSPEGFAGLHNPADVKGLLPANLPDRPSHLKRMLEVAGLASLQPDAYRKIRADYLDQVSYSDWLLGELMEAIERTHHSSDTALFVVSDHGDYAGDFGLVEKWPSGMERCLTHVPMIARVPGCKAGHRVAEPVQLFDLMPTALELAGTEATHTHFARSLVPQIHGAAGDPERAVLTEGGYNTYEAQCFEPLPPKASWYYDRLKLQIEEPVTVSRVAAIRTSEYTFVSRPQGVSEFYLRKDDPQELHNRFGDAALSDLQHKAEQRLAHWYVNTTGVAPVDRDPRGFPAPGAAPAAPRRNVPAATFPKHTADVILDAG